MEISVGFIVSINVFNRPATRNRRASKAILALSARPGPELESVPGKCGQVRDRIGRYFRTDRLFRGVKMRWRHGVTLVLATIGGLTAGCRELPRMPERSPPPALETVPRALTPPDV